MRWVETAWLQNALSMEALCATTRHIARDCVASMAPSTRCDSVVLARPIRTWQSAGQKGQGPIAAIRAAHKRIRGVEMHGWMDVVTDGAEWQQVSSSFAAASVASLCDGHCTA